MQAAGSMQIYRVQLVRAQAAQRRRSLSAGCSRRSCSTCTSTSRKASTTQFQITIDKVDGGRVMQLRRVARDSNRSCASALNSSAFGPGDYLLKFDGYNWRGQTEEVGWVTTRPAVSSWLSSPRSVAIGG